MTDLTPPLPLSASPALRLASALLLRALKHEALGEPGAALQAWGERVAALEDARRENPEAAYLVEELRGTREKVADLERAEAARATERAKSRNPRWARRSRR